MSSKTFIARNQIRMLQIPTAGYKGAAPEDTAKLVCDAEDKISRIQTDAGYGHVNKDKYNLEIYDDCKFKVFRLHNVENTRNFFEYANDRNKSIPLRISRYVYSPLASDEKSLFDDIKQNTYRCLAGSTLYILDRKHDIICKYKVSSRPEAIFNRHSNNSSDDSHGLFQPLEALYCRSNNCDKF